VSVRKVPISVVIESVSCTLGVSHLEMSGRSKHREVVLARSIAVLLARRHTICSYPDIANALGRANHSTVVTADKRIKALVDSGATWHDGRPFSTIAALCESELEMRRFEADRAHQAQEDRERTRLEVRRTRLAAVQKALEKIMRLPAGQLGTLNLVAMEALYDCLSSHPTILEALGLATRQDAKNGPAPASRGGGVTDPAREPIAEGGRPAAGGDRAGRASGGETRAAEAAGGVAVLPGRTRVA
jgi:hypothetical protein